MNLNGRLTRLEKMAGPAPRGISWHETEAYQMAIKLCTALDADRIVERGPEYLNNCHRTITYGAGAGDLYEAWHCITEKLIPALAEKTGWRSGHGLSSASWTSYRANTLDELRQWLMWLTEL